MSGKPLSADFRAVARNGIAVVWQDLALCDNLDVAANLLLGRERRRLMFSESRFHADAAGLLADLGIPISDTTREVSTLSRPSARFSRRWPVLSPWWMAW